MHNYNGNFYGMHLFWWIIIIVFVLLVIFFISKQGKTSNSKTSIEILKERFAKGEITKDEFEKSKKTLTQD